MVRAALVVTVDPPDAVLEQAHVAAKGKSIAAIGTDMPASADRVVDARAKRCCQGLLGCMWTRHCRKDLPLMEYLDTTCFPLAVPLELYSMC